MIKPGSIRNTPHNLEWATAENLRLNVMHIQEQWTPDGDNIVRANIVKTGRAFEIRRKDRTKIVVTHHATHQFFTRYPNTSLEHLDRVLWDLPVDTLLSYRAVDIDHKGFRFVVQDFEGIYKIVTIAPLDDGSRET